MKQPSFWEKKSFLNILLVPLSIIYLLVTYIRNRITKRFTPEKPVICIGNVTSGGAGKTPTAIAIANIFKDMGKKPVFLSRGYGGSLNVTTVVNPDLHKSKDTGDEPLLLSRVATTIVSKNRVTGVKLACEKDFDVIIMDDGLQNPTIEKTSSLLVIDGTFGLGSGFIFPAGPLREGLQSALDKVDGIIFIGEDKTFLLPKLKSKTVIKAKIVPVENRSKKVKYVAFAGLGNPNKFFTTLVENGYNLVQKVPYADHYQYGDKDMEDLNNLADSWSAKLITTEKDFVRLSNEQQRGVETLPIAIEFEDESSLRSILKKCF